MNDSRSIPGEYLSRVARTNAERGHPLIVCSKCESRMPTLAGLRAHDDAVHGGAANRKAALVTLGWIGLAMLAVAVAGLWLVVASAPQVAS